MFILFSIFFFEHFQSVGPVAWWPGRGCMMDAGRQQRPQGFEETASTAEPVIQDGICFVGRFSLAKAVKTV